MNGTHETTSSMDMQPTSSPINAMYVWDKMQDVFGSSWVNQYGLAPNSTWIDALAQLSESDINRGLNALLKSRAKYAPNLSVFLGMCELVDDRTPEQRAFDARRKEFEAARAFLKLSNPEIRKAEILKMKQMMGVKS